MSNSQRSASIASSPSSLTSFPSSSHFRLPSAQTPPPPPRRQRQSATAISPAASSVNRPPSIPDASSPVAGGLVYGPAGSPAAWWTPIQPAGPSRSRISSSSSSSSSKAGAVTETPTDAQNKADASQAVEMVPMSTRPRLRKTDEKGEPVWPFELEAVLIAGLRKYHATSARPRPSASRNFNRNRLVSEYIERVTGQKRSTKQIASRIQVLRDAWKGTKQYALVAQPRELSEMGYLPSLDDYGPDKDAFKTPSQPETNSTGPVRNARATRRSLRNRKKAHENWHVDLADADPEMVKDTAFAKVVRKVPSTVSAAPSSPTETSRTRNWTPAPLTVQAPGPSSQRDSNDGLHGPTSVDGQAPSTLPPINQPSPVVLNLSDLTNLGNPVTDLDGVVPHPASLPIRLALRKNTGVATFLAQVGLPLRSPALSGSSPCVVLEIDSGFVTEKINALAETLGKKAEVGNAIQVLQNADVYDDENTVLDRVAGLVERGDPLRSQRPVLGTGTEPTHRYPLSIPTRARELLRGGEAKHALVVQRVSILRTVDSRLLASFIVLWIVQPTCEGSSDPKILVSSLNYIDKRPTKQPSVRSVQQSQSPPTAASQPPGEEDDVLSSSELTPVVPAMTPTECSQSLAPEPTLVAISQTSPPTVALSDYGPSSDGVDPSTEVGLAFDMATSSRDKEQLEHGLFPETMDCSGYLQGDGEYVAVQHPPSTVHATPNTRMTSPIYHPISTVSYGIPPSMTEPFEGVELQRSPESASAVTSDTSTVRTGHRNPMPSLELGCATETQRPLVHSHTSRIISPPHVPYGDFSPPSSASSVISPPYPDFIRYSRLQAEQWYPAHSSQAYAVEQVSKGQEIIDATRGFETDANIGVHARPRVPADMIQTQYRDARYSMDIPPGYLSFPDPSFAPNSLDHHQYMGGYHPEPALMRRASEPAPATCSGHTTFFPSQYYCPIVQTTQQAYDTEYGHSAGYSYIDPPRYGPDAHEQTISRFPGISDITPETEGHYISHY